MKNSFVLIRLMTIVLFTSLIDFGSGCLGHDGHIRYGKISTVYTGRLLYPGNSATTTLDGYKIDSISIEGKQVITNTGSVSQKQFTVDITGGKLTKPSGNYEQ